MRGGAHVRGERSHKHIYKRRSKITCSNKKAAMLVEVTGLTLLALLNSNCTSSDGAETKPAEEVVVLRFFFISV